MCGAKCSGAPRGATGSEGPGDRSCRTVGRREPERVDDVFLGTRHAQLDIEIPRRTARRVRIAIRARDADREIGTVRQALRGSRADVALERRRIGRRRHEVFQDAGLGRKLEAEINLRLGARDSFLLRLRGTLVTSGDDQRGPVGVKKFCTSTIPAHSAWATGSLGVGPSGRNLTLGPRRLQQGSTQSGPDVSAQSIERVARLGRNVRQPNHALAN